MANKGRASRATPSATSRGNQTRPGDATGKERDRLANENADAQREAAQRMSLITLPPVVERPDEVVDYTDGGSAHVGDAPQRTMSVDEALADGVTSISDFDRPDDQVDLNALPDGKTDVLPEVVNHSNEPQPAHGERRDSQQQVRRQDASLPTQAVERREAPVVEQAHKILRVNTDLEDITIGKDNHYTFRTGVRYKVPAHVYDHLAEKGYVYG